jgi:2-polyprenyl-6-hydroxyphenyl methylase/3-demethylubiquinone-9 3-methyltransferase
MKKIDLLSAESHFAFGKNWLDYSLKIDEEKINQAIKDLQRISGRDRLDGLSFLDIGCGSGLHSLAAIRMGASRVFGVDIDEYSVAASRQTIARFASDSNADFEVLSIFNMQPATYGVFDIVYSWGVLHHTGDMYRALKCAASLVAPDGLLLIALYRKTLLCSLWRKVKRWYTSATPKAQERARNVFIGMHRCIKLIQGDILDNYIKSYNSNRGMDYFNDVHDWMGGFPYESISPNDCHKFFLNLGFVVKSENIAAVGVRSLGLLGSGCDEFSYRKN